ncbi:UDP-2,3-diacylglucosamine diphosphatase [Govanella unica]|uniref:UDP-2,3-diacylglucosamine diphosphatase n=1 Tax=Govanella unica TaxID=2975056 RepID=A0A9X3TZU5_9PROT|nr:UDP-2,3-diacylglucosamine diphosphatase [Govania unica]MDA5194816.1 UDP-2,3-diacylglucosamine diphosphatase [Govania unica]
MAITAGDPAEARTGPFPAAFREMPPLLPPFLWPDSDKPETPDSEIPKHRYRSIWISDIHLGTRGANAELLLSFLKHTESEQLYLVGDIVDGWALKRSWYWQQSHNDVVQKILRKARKGTRVVYIPGNHDEALRPYAGLAFGDVAIEREVIHVTADGRRFLVFHGDEFDGVMQYAKWLAHLGDMAYMLSLHLNTLVNRGRRRLGMPYWSLSAYLKHKVKNAVAFIASFENLIIAEARRRGMDGVICGHIHHAEIRDMDGITYANDGDWVESCTALVEDFSGALRIIRWAEEMPSGRTGSKAGTPVMATV